MHDPDMHDPDTDPVDPHVPQTAPLSKRNADLVHSKSRELNLTPHEVGLISPYEVNMLAWLYLWAFITVALIVGLFWPEWSGNYWAPAHFYMPFMLILSMHLVMKPIDFGQALMKSTLLDGSRQDGSRHKFSVRTQPLILLTIYTISIGAVLEIMAVVYLAIAHARNSVDLVQNTGLTILAYVISASALAVMGGMIWTLLSMQRVAQDVINKQRAPNEITATEWAQASTHRLEVVHSDDPVTPY